MPAPQYDARTVTAPDGTRITVAYQHGSHLAHLTDAEFLAAVRWRTHTAQDDDGTPPAPQPDTMPATVTNLAAERIRRRGRQLPHGRP
ncbi:hypothetical protein [Streptomyces hygroscopicus]|uniref:hypothetical protein n=1 Tax=Streptomyces hygroscopicus TaxID=1912 RepID=UPI0033E244CA